MSSVIRSGAQMAKQLVFPEAVILVAVVVLLQPESLRPSIENLGRPFAFIVFAGGTLLAWRFHRGRVVFTMLALAVAAFVIERVGGGAGAAPADGVADVAFNGLAVLLPLNLLGITLLGERGLMTLPGLLRLAFLPLQIGLVALLVYLDPSPGAAWFTVEFLPVRGTSWTPLPHPALVAYAVTFIWMAVHLVLHLSGTARGFLWALVASFLALHTAQDTLAATTYLGTAGLILVVGVIEATYFIAFRDQLTELPARRAFNSALLELGGRYSVAMVDIDRFKKFNDEHGHDVGDQVLKLVATQLGEVSGGGKAYRYGGEEFAILFPGKARDDCEPHLERVRQAVAEATFTVRSRMRPRTKPQKPRKSRRRRKQLSVTVSIGVAERNDRYTTPEKVMKAADRALYRAKDGGRNQIRR